jgi:NAD(P)-dependent dehydrogenase (short-subunit alcohol dehydrogenase family)
MDTRIAHLLSLHNKKVLVTGASSGLGRHMAKTLAAAGAELVLAARNQAALAALVDELQATGAAAHAVALDVSDEAQVKAAFAQINERHGAMDVVVNNAGVTVTKPLLQQTAADWDHVLDTNLRGSFLVTTEAARAMVATQKAGTVINLASILGERVAGAIAGYCASKAGLVQLTKSTALELARHGIRCNALLPGYVVTELNREFLDSEAGEKLRSRIPSRQFGQMSDLDGPLLLLASDAGRHITGATLAVDGGHLVSSL